MNINYVMWRCLGWRSWLAEEGCSILNINSVILDHFCKTTLMLSKACLSITLKNKNVQTRQAWRLGAHSNNQLIRTHMHITFIKTLYLKPDLDLAV